SVLIAVGAIQAAYLGRQRTQILQEAEERAGDLAYVLAEYVRNSFAVADTSLRQLAVHGRRVGGVAAPDAAWAPILLSARDALPGVGSISVTSADGVIRHSTHPAIIGQPRNTQYLYRRLSTIGRDELIVDTPFLVENPRRYLIPIGRRLETAIGRFDGVAAATVGPDVYREFFRAVDVGPDGIASMFHAEGVVVFREPSTADPIGEAASDSPLFRAALQASGRGVVVGPLEPAGPSFVSAYQTLNTLSLIVAVSLSRGHVLSGWYDHLVSSLLAFGALTATLAGIVFVLFRQMNERARVEQELSDVQRLEEIRLLETNERLEAALERERRARHDTEEASRLKDEFLMTLSHELRTPLTAIYGWVRMLSTEIVPPDQRARALAAVERNARAQTRLIDDLLDVSRAISGKLRLDARAINVADVVMSAIETLEPALDAKNIQIEKALDPDAGVILADPDRVQQIVWNLLSNAIKFTPDRGSVQIRVARVESGVEIVVRDTGVGIAPEFVPFVFERFRQEDAGTRRRFGGLGLGLAIVRHLVELHGGTVAAASDGEGYGASFSVFLPARAARRPAVEGHVVARPTPRDSAAAIRLDG
ncbi:MAG: sensor histidine kinase, partial [Vicinamibacterales bacterium]